MEEIKFRPRVLPIPKVGDEIKDVYGNTSVVSAHNKYEPSLFSVVLSDGKHHCYDSLDNIWSWQDPADEAQRLMEAAYRVDTSELPEWIEGAIRFCKADNMEITLENLAWCAVQGNCENMEQATRFLVNELPCLLRWQYQQQLKES